MKVILLDVDGVLKKGTEPLTCGQQAMDYLEQTQTPYILVSNTTGDDDVVTKHLSNIIQRTVTKESLVTASTPLIELVNQLQKNTPILAIGAPRFTKPFFVQNQFTNVVYPNEFYLQYQQAFPQYRFCQTSPTISNEKSTYDDRSIEYIIFHADSTDWYADIQLCMDCLLNYGQLNPQLKGDPSHVVKVICTNPDLTYSDVHCLPRLTVGSLVFMVKSLYEKMANKKLEIEYYGKPYSKIFQVAKSRFPPDSTFYLIGDSLQSDILGANENNCHSVLVLTGKATREEAETVEEKMKPETIYSDVYEAVKAIVGK